MMRRLALAAVLVGALAGGSALASTPLDPGGDDAGFVPPNRDALHCEDNVARNLRKAMKCIGVRCHRKNAIFLLKGRNFPEQSCEKRCTDKFHELDNKLVGCGACLDADARAALLTSAQDYMRAHNGDMFCDGTIPFGDGLTGAVPPGRLSLHCEQFVTKQVALAMGCIEKCHIDKVDGRFGGGTFLDEDCENICRIKYESLNAEVDSACPTCLKFAQRTAIFGAIEDFLDQKNGDVYCASPSGAFVQ